MRHPASEKLEIIRLVEQSHLPIKKTLEKLGISRATFYRWCDLYQTGGLEALADKPSRPLRVWNRIPDQVRGEIVQLALDEPKCRALRRGAKTTKPLDRSRPAQGPFHVRGDNTGA